MSKRTLYVRDVDLPIWEAAQNTLGEKSMSTLVTQALLEKLQSPMAVTFDKTSSVWLSENAGRSVITLVDLTALDSTVIPYRSITYVNGASGTNDIVDTVTLMDVQGSEELPRMAQVLVKDLGSVWDWNRSDGKTQVVPSQLLKACKDLCIAAFKSADEQSKKDALLSLYQNLKWASGSLIEDADNPIGKYARHKMGF